MSGKRQTLIQEHIARLQLRAVIDELYSDVWSEMSVLIESKKDDKNQLEFV